MVGILENFGKHHFGVFQTLCKLCFSENLVSLDSFWNFLAQVQSNIALMELPGEIPVINQQYWPLHSREFNSGYDRKCGNGHNMAIVYFSRVMESVHNAALLLSSVRYLIPCIHGKF